MNLGEALLVGSSLLVFHVTALPTRQGGVLAVVGPVLALAIHAADVRDLSRTALPHGPRTGTDSLIERSVGAESVLRRSRSLMLRGPLAASQRSIEHAAALGGPLRTPCRADSRAERPFGPGLPANGGQSDSVRRNPLAGYFWWRLISSLTPYRSM
jgi:hypothetical protein